MTLYHFQIKLLVNLFDKVCELRDYYRYCEVEFCYLHNDIMDATDEDAATRAKNRLLAFEKESEEEIGRRIKDMGSIFKRLQRDRVDPTIVFTMLEWGLPEHINPLRSEEAMNAWNTA